MVEGLKTETQVLNWCVQHNIIVSLPYGGQERYDHIWDINGKLYRIQIKSAHEVENGFTVAGRLNGKYTEKDNIDAFVTYYNNNVYYIPFEEISADPVKLWTRLPKDRNNLKKIKWADDYIFKLNDI